MTKMSQERRDAIARGMRAANVPKASYFTDDEVREVRSLLNAGLSAKEIAEMYDLDDVMIIHHIRTGRNYSRVK